MIVIEAELSCLLYFIQHFKNIKQLQQLKNLIFLIFKNLSKNLLHKNHLHYKIKSR